MPKVKSKIKVALRSKAIKKAAKVSVAKSSAKASVPSKSSAPSVIRKQSELPKTKSTGLTVKVYNTSGKVTGSTSLPKEMFGAKVNKKLLAQALHIYFTNQSSHFAHTKTRGEVRGGGRKPWRQKGTGNARAGSRRSPLWVGGGITFGPRSRKVRLDLPKKMKRAALISALSAKAQGGSIKVVSNLEKIQPKTKIMANLLAKTEAQSPTLLILGEISKNTALASRNIQDTKIETTNNLNAYLIWQNQNILISKEALAKFT